MTELSPRVVIQFPKKHRKADCQREHVPYPISLSERLKRIGSGLDAGMTLADVQHEYDAQQGEKVIEHWVLKLASNPRRSPSDAASFLCRLADRLKREIAS